MLLRKFMSLVGVGSAKIDLELEKATFKAGERIQGYYQLKGGVIDQQLKRIECDLIKVDEEEVMEETIDSITMLTTEVIETEEVDKIPFSFQLPAPLPSSSERTSYYFKTRLFFTEGVESKDEDVIHII